MLLTIDVRTTSIELGLFSGSGAHANLVRHWRIHTNPLLTADEFAMQVRGLVGAHLDEVVGVAALSTVPPVLRELRLMLERYWNHVPHVVVEPGVRTGIPLLVDNPKEVGADRIVNSLAAYDKFGTAAIVIDFGVSTCVDLVSAKGEFLGGVLAPGVEISTEALIERAALRRVELARPRSVVGKNTVECIQSGAVFGFAGLVDGLVDRIRDDVDAFAGDDVAVVATGAGAPLIVPESETIDHHEPRLTLTGLRLVYERNQRNRRA
ncbi:type III pantothenate kinase [Nocardia cyriacigeorgica]|uniref:type III pantothenate kinase n=1 Tax=Nocardia cyriacigeorgica TaxID=135487 RepID=UPI001893201A|nr:type III pantothenate kinase [Nocardia cyriacigeorgica]MBF6099477.1 type III pantothenate kinase [Nocardia cyriacigeorgica]MBF6160197.1 type III pantothenate kinase [Nocardia cyriacigeorgica]MBF6199281.1 type III pantothenate kinase [Nocardia cyriacigeorgica]MBF6319229.1 type III pantothenate kinase [Nocardia cyriacigeorgica]MBF6535401.1 type III pantothenate kinase [Nocardia cyriacigeorgica]